jgi:signal transduction histidine kinase
MRALQSSTALVEKEVSGQFAALEFVHRKLDLGIVDETAGMGVAGGIGVGHEGSRGEHWRDSRLLRVAEGAGLAHDAGNLLGALSLYSELLGVPGVLNEGYREYATELRMLSERSHAMIARLVGHARRFEPNSAEALTVLPVIVMRCRGLLSRVAGRSVEVAVGAGADRPVNVPVEAVERILTNLVKNASESISGEGGSITVSIAGGEESGSDGAPCVVMTVSDTGRGMTEEAARALGAATVADGYGRGLGFRVVRELVAMSDGCLSIASQLGHGTSVSIVWRAVEQIEMEGRDGMRRAVRGAAGWIAC